MKATTHDPADLSRFAIGIKKSGFPLEYQTALTLKNAGWTVISSKYYLDDANQTPREIDLIAYKVSRVSGFNLYTTLIVSCKKAENDTWAMLSRDADRGNPNADWWPLHLWSNSKAINLQITRPGQKQWFHEESQRLGVTEALRMPEVELFAFQVMNSASGSVQNDKPIYDSIASLVQAQAYEMSALPDRRKEPAVYQFNLLTVVDADMVRLHFNGAEITPLAVESEHYIARYIVQKRQSFSRIHFIKAITFARALNDYNRLHAANSGTFANVERAFYRDALQDTEKVALFLDLFRQKIQWPLRSLLLPLGEDIEASNVDLTWNAAENRVGIEIHGGLSLGTIGYLQEDGRAQATAKQVLAEVYRYEGAFAFEQGIPF